MQIHRLLPGVVAAGLLLGPPLATAQESPRASLGPASSIDTLAELRGGAENSSTRLNVEGTTSGNSAEQVVTGSNSIGQGSFAGMSGIPLVVQNTGANVLIQNAVIVNVKMN